MIPFDAEEDMGSRVTAPRFYLGVDRVAGLFVAYIAIIAAVYLPVIVASYGFLDDYAFLAQSMQHHNLNQAQLSTAYGRPLYALIMRLVLPLIHGLAGLSILRAVGVLGIALLAMVSQVHLAHARLPHTVTLGMPILLGLMPAFQVYAAWAIAAFFPFAALLGGLAFAVLDWPPTDAEPMLPLRPIAAVALLSASLCIYQPAAMFFWVFAAISFIGAKAPVKWRTVTVAAGVMATALAIDFALAKVLPQLFWKSGAVFTRTELVRDFWTKLIWFITEPLPDALNLIFIRPSALFAGGVAIFAAVGLWLYWPGATRERIVRTLLAAAFVPATYLPNLLVSENWASYRTQVALTGLLLVYTTLGLVGWSRAFSKTAWLPAIMAAVIAGCAVAASRNVVLYFVLPQSIEYQLFNQALVNLENSSQCDIRKLDFYKADRWSLGEFGRYDEFGVLSNSAAWVPPAMAWLILSSHRSPLADLPMEVLPRGVSPASPGSRLIDLDAVMFGSTMPQTANRNHRTACAAGR